MKNLIIIIILLSIICLCACKDDDKQVCSTCNDDLGEIELCAELESELDKKVDDYLDNATGSAICIGNQ